MPVEHFFGSGKSEPLELQAAGSTGVETTGGIGRVGVKVGPFTGTFQRLAGDGSLVFINRNTVGGVEEFGDLLEPDIRGGFALRVFKDAVEEVVGEGEGVFGREVQYVNAFSVDEVFRQFLPKWLDLVKFIDHGNNIEVCGVGKVAEELGVGGSKDEGVAFEVGKGFYCLSHMGVGRLGNIGWEFPWDVLGFDFLRSKAKECAGVRADQELFANDG